MKAKLIASAILGMALVAMPLAALPAQATGTLNILEFSKDGITDPDEEDATMKGALEVLGTVTMFDGGDGSANAWSAAIAGKDAIVFPEGEVYGDTDAMSAEAATVVKDWISAGGRAIGTGAYDHSGFIDFLQGIDRSDVWCDDSIGDVWDLQVESTILPATLPNGDYTGGICEFDTWTTEQLVGVLPVFATADGTNAGMVTFQVGSGTFTYYAYDWYPNEDEALTVLPAWNEALRLGADGSIENAATGNETPVFDLGLNLDLAVGEVVAGSSVTAEASGLLAGSAWNLVLRSTPITLDLGTVGDGGSVLTTVTIPEGLEAGWHSITLTGTSADGVAYERVVRFEIASDGTLASTPVLGEITVVALASTGNNPVLPLGLGVLVLLAGVAAVVVRRQVRA